MTWQDAATGMVSIALLGTIVAVAIAQLGSTWRARGSAAREAAYRKLAEDSLLTQQQIQQGLDEMRADLERVRERTDELHRLLREVDEPWARERT